MPRHRTTILLLVLASATAVSAWQLGRQVPRTPFTGDESGWTSASYYYSQLLLHGDSERAKWELPRYRTYGNLNPPLGKFILGIPLILYAHAFHGGEHFDRFFWASQGYKKNKAEGRVPPDDQLFFGRGVSALCGAGCVTVLFFLLWRCAGYAAALAGAAQLLLNPLFAASVTRLMTDSSYNLFLLAASIPLIGFLRAPQDSKAWRYFAAAGLLAGMAASVKVSGIVFAGLEVGALLVLLRLLARISARQFWTNLMVFNGIAVGFCLLINPYFWPEPSAVDGAELVKEVRAFAIEGVRPAPPPIDALTADDVLRRQEAQQSFFAESMKTDFPNVYRLLRPLELPILILRWKLILDFYAQQTPWPGNRITVIVSRTFHDFATFPFQALVVFTGVLACGIAGFRSIRRDAISPLLIPLLHFAICFGMSLLTQNIDWERYYLPTVVAVQVLAGIGAGLLLQQLFSFARRSRNRAA